MKQDTVDPAVRDGRSSRWDRHRARRRRELVRAAREAVHELGPGVSMEEIAAHAGTSKSVFYRYFGDRAGLRRAVAERVTERVEQRLREAADSSPDGPSALHRMVAECLAVASSSPAVYAFAITEAEPDADGAPVLGPFFERVSHVLADGLARALPGEGLWPASPLSLWPRGAVGMVRAVVEAWLAVPADDRPGRDETADAVTRWLLDGLHAPALISPLIEEH